MEQPLCSVGQKLNVKLYTGWDHAVLYLLRDGQHSMARQADLSQNKEQELADDCTVRDRAIW